MPSSVYNKILRSWWSVFVPSWFTPVIWLLYVTVEEAVGPSPSIVRKVLIGLGVIAFSCPAVRYMRGEVNLRSVVLWGMLVPFLLFALAALVRLVILAVPEK